jgi:DivIVA domain-containing protein
MLVPGPPPEGASYERTPAVTFVFVGLGVVVIVVTALLASGKLGELPDVEPDRPPVFLPDTREVESTDVDAVRFAVGMRGYRMDEVDEVLDRISADLAERDARIADLERLVASKSDEPAPASDFAHDVVDSAPAAPAEGPAPTA